MAREPKRIYGKSKSVGRKFTMTERKKERPASIQEWQNRWDASFKGKCTHRLIGNVQA